MGNAVFKNIRYYRYINALVSLQVLSMVAFLWLPVLEGGAVMRMQLFLSKFFFLLSIILYVFISMTLFFMYKYKYIIKFHSKLWWYIVSIVLVAYLIGFMKFII